MSASNPNSSIEAIQALLTKAGFAVWVGGRGRRQRPVLLAEHRHRSAEIYLAYAEKLAIVRGDSHPQALPCALAGLRAAVLRYDFTNRIRFSAYARSWVENYIDRRASLSPAETASAGPD